MAASSKKIESDLEGLFDLFLSPHFDPDVFLDTLPGSDNDDQFDYEAAGDSGNFEFESDGNFPDETEFTGHAVMSQEKLHMGRVLAKLGDDFYKFKQPVFAESREEVTSHIRDVFRPVQQLTTSIPEAAQEETWKQFKGILDKSISGTVVEDGFQILGALLLTINGLRTFKTGVKLMARRFAVRYVNELHIPAQLEARGGLECLD